MALPAHPSDKSHLEQTRWGSISGGELKSKLAFISLDLMAETVCVSQWLLVAQPRGYGAGSGRHVLWLKIRTRKSHGVGKGRRGGMVILDLPNSFLPCGETSCGRSGYEVFFVETMIHHLLTCAVKWCYYMMLCAANLCDVEGYQS
jgi:hypothetical protein